MPQFDFSTFSAQIFWLLICFAIFYYFVSRVIIPRISAILTNREETVSNDLISAQSLQTQIDELEANSKKLRDNSASKYQESIDSALKKCVADREKSLNKVKDDIEKLTLNSEKKITDFVKKSKTDYSKAASDLADVVVKKLLGPSLKLGKKVEVSINKYDN